MKISPPYVVVQAGGKGTRMEYLTRNKPKALVPINNRPMLFHLFEKFPNSKFIVIGDYKYDALEKYLNAFAEVKYSLVCATGRTGTCAGLSQALKKIPEATPFLLVWSDLVLPGNFEIPNTRHNLVGISQGFRCRWRYENGHFEEIPSEQTGVAGLFFFTDKKLVSDVPESGEFVRWLQSKEMEFQCLPLLHTNEYGLLEEYSKIVPEKCRPFNEIEVFEDRVIKRPIDKQGETLAICEARWYAAVKNAGFRNIPTVYSTQPLVLERIRGGNVYEYGSIPREKKRDILQDIISCLKEVHSLKIVPAEWESVHEAYIKKTFDRLEKVRELVPFANNPMVEINGKQCKNVFFHREEIERLVKLLTPEEFCLIHGDCTFSNIMVREDLSPVLIDPRGYFGHMELYGDADYDWAKLYYSLRGDYDQFNLKRFSLDIGDKSVALEIQSNDWKILEEDFFKLIGDQVSVKKIKLLHALIWLSLTTYAWENYDSICGAFYNGLCYLEEIL